MAVESNPVVSAGDASLAKAAAAKAASPPHLSL
jgi:hypothetical protein